MKMLCDEDLTEKMEIFVKPLPALLSFSFREFNLI